MCRLTTNTLSLPLRKVLATLWNAYNRPNVTILKSESRPTSARNAYREDFGIVSALPRNRRGRPPRLKVRDLTLTRRPHVFALFTSTVLHTKRLTF